MTGYQSIREQYFLIRSVPTREGWRATRGGVLLEWREAKEVGPFFLFFVDPH